MRLLILLLLVGQSTAAPPPGLKALDMKGSGPLTLTVRVPEAYEPHPHLSRRYERKPTIAVPDIVTLRLTFLDVKRPDPPPAPGPADLMFFDSSLTNLKVTGSVETWRGRQVPSARFEGFIQGQTGVFGRMVWLPLQPGTVVVELYAEPAWVQTMNQDWDLLLANIEGPMSEFTLRERAPGRWKAAMTLIVLSILVFLAGIVMILARMNEAVGVAAVYVGLLLPIVPLGYAVLNLHQCRRGLIVALAGAALFGVSFLLQR